MLREKVAYVNANVLLDQWRNVAAEKQFGSESFSLSIKIWSIQSNMVLKGKVSVVLNCKLAAGND